jgi:signal transduction histidine kinase
MGINLILVAMIIWPEFIIKEVNIRPGLEKQIIFSNYYWFYFIYTSFFFTAGFYRLFKKYLKSIGIERLQILYLLLGYSVAANLAFITNLILPWVGYFFVNWLGQVFTGIMVVFTSYAILRYRLMDIRIVTRKAFIYFVSSAFAYGFFYFLIWFYNGFLGGIFSRSSYIVGLFVAPSFVIIFLWFYSALQKIANRYFFYTLYNYQRTINGLSERLNYINDLDEINNLIVDTVKQSMQLDRACVFLLKEDGGTTFCKATKSVGPGNNKDIDFLHNEFFLKYIRERQKPLIREELPMMAKRLNDEKEIKSLLELNSDMEKIEASLCLPLTSSKKLIGIIVLGPKISGDAYTKEDLELLNTLSYQAGIAIDNARLYREIQDFNKNLQQKVDEQTKELRKAYEVEKKARQELEKLDKNKNQFLLTIQHHLRTPLTAMMGYGDLILNGTFGKAPKKIVDVIKKMQVRTQELIKMVNEFLDITQFQLGKEIILLKPGVDVDDIIRESVEELKFEAEEKGIYLKFEKQKIKILPVKADREKLKAAIFNIIDNAVKYTDKGGVVIKIEDGKNVKITVSDTGIGIPKERLENLFDRIFERGEGAEKTFATGRGIGLYLSGQIIKYHNGKIWAESEGDGKGATFYIELPSESAGN